MHGLHCNSPIYDPHIDGMTGAHQHAQLCFGFCVFEIGSLTVYLD
jgi:hypothetical protein